MTSRPATHDDAGRNRRAPADTVQLHFDPSPPHLTYAAIQALLGIMLPAGPSCGAVGVSIRDALRLGLQADPSTPLPAPSVESAPGRADPKRGRFDLPAISPRSPRGWSEGLRAGVPRARSR
jgi:hypothetical protein